jgi:hypothetical protein
VAGYTGWKEVETVERQVKANANVTGVLVIDSGLFFSSIQGLEAALTGPWALWGLISVLHLITNSLQAAATDPFDYAT